MTPPFNVGDKVYGHYADESLAGTVSGIESGSVRVDFFVPHVDLGASDVFDPADVSPNLDEVDEPAPATPEAPICEAPIVPTTFRDRCATGQKYHIPCMPVGGDDGKKPFVPNWQNIATTDPAQIEKWNAEYPTANSGMVAKAELGGFWVLECDSDDVAKRYKKDTGQDLPDDTLIVQSRPGRYHRWFKQTDASIAMGNLAQSHVRDGDFSARVKNEQAVGPRSFRPDLNIEYRLVNDTAPIEAPPALIQWLTKQKVSGVNKAESKSSANNPTAASEAPIPSGSRNSALASLGGSLHHRGLSDALVLEALLEANENRCSPPLPNEEVKIIARSVCRYDTSQHARNAVSIGGSVSATVTVPDLISAYNQIWGEPQPLGNSLLPVKPFKLGFLPSSLQPWAKDIYERMSVPLDFVGVCMLCALAGCINRRAFVFPKANDKDWKESISISGAVISSSGKMKTPTWKVSINPMQELDIDWQNDYKTKLAAYKSELTSHEDAEKLRKKDAEKLRKKDQSDAGALFASTAAPVSKALTAPIEPEPCRRLVVNDATPEKFHDLMSSNPQGLFAYRDEMSSWVSELDQKGREAERGLFLAAMNGNDIFTLDRIGRGSVTATMSASLFGGFQPQPLIKFLSDERNKSDGTIARFGALVWPDDSAIPLIDRAANTEAKDRFRRTIRILAELKPEAAFLHFAPEAQSLFNDWLQSHVAKVEKETNTAKQSHLSKYKGLLPKLAALLQLADVVATVPNVSGHHSIDLDHLNRAIDLVAYFESHADRVYACVKSPERKAEEALAQHIQSGDLKDGFSIRDVWKKGWEGLAKNYAEDAILALEELGWIREIPQVKSAVGGRPTLRFEINPVLKKKYSRSEAA